MGRSYRKIRFVNRPENVWKRSWKCLKMYFQNCAGLACYDATVLSRHRPYQTYSRWLDFSETLLNNYPLVIKYSTSSVNFFFCDPLIMNEGLTLSHLWHVFESFEDQCTARQQSLLWFRNTRLGQVESHKGCYCERAPQWNCCQEQSKTWSGEIRCTSRKVNWSGMHLVLGKHRHCRCLKNKLFFVGIIGTSWTGRIKRT